MQKKIVELKIEQTKAVVGGIKVATAATAATAAVSASSLASAAAPIATLV